MRTDERRDEKEFGIKTDSIKCSSLEMSESSKSSWSSGALDSILVLSVDLQTYKKRRWQLMRNDVTVMIMFASVLLTEDEKGTWSAFWRWESTDEEDVRDTRDVTDGYGYWLFALKSILKELLQGTLERDKRDESDVWKSVSSVLYNMLYTEKDHLDTSGVGKRDRMT